MDKNFYDNNLKKTIAIANGNVFMSRMGNSCTDNFVKNMNRGECLDETRHKVKFDPNFRSYFTDNPVRPRSAVNFEVF